MRGTVLQFDPILFTISPSEVAMHRLIGRRRFLEGRGSRRHAGRVGWLPTRAEGSRPDDQAKAAAALVCAPASIASRGSRCALVPSAPQGPRLDVEKIGTKTVVHNYGHGGSGWSLSWGSGAIATANAMATGERDIAVIGCGALGLTTALLLQRAGARVTIYAKDLPPNVRSSLATGLYTPDSRICLEEHATPAFKQTWEQMARQSFHTYLSFLGVPGTPVEFIDSYACLRRRPRAGASQRARRQAGVRGAAAGVARRSDAAARTISSPDSHPLGQRHLLRYPQLMFNLTAYTHTLLAEFNANGGKIEITEFHTPADFARLKEKTLVNATGYGARALFGDQSLVPVRGQLARMIPEAGRELRALL